MLLTELRLHNCVKCTVSNDAGIYAVLVIDSQMNSVTIDRAGTETHSIRRIAPVKLGSNVDILKKVYIETDQPDNCFPEVQVEGAGKEIYVAKIIWEYKDFYFQLLHVGRGWWRTFQFEQERGKDFQYLHDVQNFVFYNTDKKIDLRY